MYQPDRGAYRNKETLAHQFRHSCLGQIIIFAGISAIVLLLAYFTKPSESTMKAEMNDDVRQCIEACDSLSNDWIDDIVANTGYIFTSADSLKDTDDQMVAFNKYNALNYFHHTFYSTVYLHNNFYPQGKRCGLGVFGMVIPMLNYNDLILSNELMRSDTINQKLIEFVPESEYFGENPGLAPYRFRGE